MMIKMKIERFEKNENYEAEMKQYEQFNSFTATSQIKRPYPERSIGVLEVEITEEQFQAIRKSVLEVF